MNLFSQKRALALVATVSACGLAGCVGTATLRSAQGYKTVEGVVVKTEDRKPCLYLLLPIAMALDIATFPIQFPFLSAALKDQPQQPSGTEP